MSADNSQMPGTAIAKEKLKRKHSANDQVLVALSDSRYEFRTIDGIAKATGLHHDEVMDSIKSLGDKVRISDVTDSKGQLLYTLASRSKTLRERVSEVRSFMAAGNA